jgi:hypothetical protein
VVLLESWCGIGREGKDYRSLIETICFKSRTWRFLVGDAVVENGSGRNFGKSVFDRTAETGAMSEA